MSTSAISGRIVFKQGPRAYLEANIRRNSLVFDTDNNIILYSPSGTGYYEFFPGQGGGVSGDVPWSNIIGSPIASNSTSGLLSISDWNKFNDKVDVSALSGIGSGSGTVSSVGISSNTLIVSNSPIISSGTISVELSSVVVSGISTKVSYDEFGRVVSGGTLVSADIPDLEPSKIVTDSSNRFVSDIQINSWTSVSVSAHTHTNKSTLDNINQNLNTSASVLFASISATNFNDTNFSGGYSLVSDNEKNVVESGITSETLNYLSGTSANIQTQINSVKSLIPQTIASTNTSGLMTSSDWNTFNSKSNITSSDVLTISTNVTTSGISSIGLVDMGDYIQTTKPLVLPNGVTFTPFTQRYISGSPSVSSMVISAGISQTIKLPLGTTHRLWWYGVGPFAYRTGTSSVSALNSDFPAMVGYTQLIITSDEYLAVYGIGSGSVTIEAGDGGLNSVISENTISSSAIATSSTNGLLTSADWTIFNNKKNDVNFDEYTLLVVGDSITNQESKTARNEYNSGFNNFLSLGAVNWMQSILKDNSFQRVHFRGRSGMRSDELYTSARPGWTLDEISKSSNAKHVLVGLGTNDVQYAGITSEQAASALSAICMHFKNEGRIIHLKSIYPRRVSDATWTSALQLKQLRLNNYIQQMCVKNGFEYVPVSEVLTDFTQTSAYICSANGIRSTYDAIHINNYGAMIQGICLADHFKNVCNNVPKTGPLHYLDQNLVDNTSQNLVSNPLFAVTSGASTSSWTLATTYGGGPVTTAIVPSPDGIGYAIQFDVSGVSSAPSSTSTLLFQTFSLLSAFRTSGNNLVGSVRVKLSQYGSSAGSPTNAYYPWFHASVTNNGTSGWGAIAGLYGDNGNNSPLDRSIDILIKTPPLSFTGIESSVSNLLRIGCMCGVGASFRMTVFSPTIKLNGDPYDNHKNYMWTDTDPPTYPTL